MASKQDLEALDSVFLALMCKKLSEDPSADADAKETARQMKEEWLRLTALETPPLSSVKEQEQIKSELAALKSQMAGFLAPFV